ncbi:MAG TPA: hypothetical protein VJB87_04325 [Candidatus Nanoarchaeia archaeon]|nr:hypothetical protein [Candidatus Nanoarchaeia archaeon]
MEKKKLILPIILGLIMVLSIFGIVIDNTTNQPEITKTTYHETEYTLTNNIWVTTKNGIQIYFYYPPEELDNTTITTQLTDLQALKIYISLDTTKNIQLLTQAVQQKIIPLLQNSQIVTACTQDDEPCKDLPLKTCQDATPEQKVIILTEGNSSITYDNNCLTLQTTPEQATKDIDSLLFRLLEL